MDQILRKDTHGRKDIERESYVEVLAHGTGTIQRVDQFNTDKKNITVDMKNITENWIQRKNKKYAKKEVCGKQKPVCLGDVCSQVLGADLNMDLEKERRFSL